MRHLLILVLIFSVCILMVLLGKLFASVLRIRSPYFPLLMGGFETGMVGMAVFISVYGKQRLPYLAIVDWGQEFFVFFVLVALLAQLKQGSQSFAQSVKRFMTSPVIIAILLGILVSILRSFMNFTGSSPYQTFQKLLDILGNTTVPLICIVIGYELRIEAATLRLSVMTIFVRTALLIVLAFSLGKLLFARVLFLAPIYQYALLTLFILPPPFVIPVFMDQTDARNRRYVVSTLSLGTLVSLFVFLAATALYG